MQAPRAHVRRRGERTLIVKLVTLQALEQVEPVAFVGPERVHARPYKAYVLRPVVLDVRGVDGLTGRRGNRAAQRRELVTVPRYHVDDDLHVPVVHVGEYDLWVTREHLGVELERRLLRVPPPRTEAGAEVDDGVERDPFRPERVDDPEHLLLVLERPMRLHVAERPPGRQRGRSGDARVVLEC